MADLIVGHKVVSDFSPGQRVIGWLLFGYALVNLLGQ
jgi:hypothetical protein